MDLSSRTLVKFTGATLTMSSIGTLGFGVGVTGLVVSVRPCKRTTESRNTCTYCSVGCGTLVDNLDGNPTEAHLRGFKWVMEVKHLNHAKLVLVNPRFTRTTSVANVYAPKRVMPAVLEDVLSVEGHATRSSRRPRCDTRAGRPRRRGRLVAPRGALVRPVPIGVISMTRRSNRYSVPADATSGPTAAIHERIVASSDDRDAKLATEIVMSNFSEVWSAIGSMDFGIFIQAPIPEGPIDRTLHDLQTVGKPRANHTLACKRCITSFTVR
jgi:hypothetical protein